MPQPTSRYRLALFATVIVAFGVVAGWTLASLRHDRPASPLPQGSAWPDNRPASPPAFVLILDSEPQGAAVVEGDQKLGTTPARVSVDNDGARRSPRMLTLERAGFLPYSIVQGASDHDVHVVAVLEATTKAAPVANAPAERPPVLTIPRPPKLMKTATASAEPPPLASSAPLPAPAPTPDIRLQR
jgi:serine/threonine-protein kinase